MRTGPAVSSNEALRTAGPIFVRIGDACPIGSKDCIALKFATRRAITRRLSWRFAELKGFGFDSFVPTAVGFQVAKRLRRKGVLHIARARPPKLGDTVRTRESDRW
jgi:hypothetical protein